MLVAAFAAPFTTKLDSEWESYKMTHNKQYEADIEPLRLVYIHMTSRYFLHAGSSLRYSIHS